jgi:hypothetical protein
MGSWSCKKFVATPIPSSILQPNQVFASDGSATSALLGGYYSVNGAVSNVYSYASLFSDELIYANASGIVLQAMTNTYDNTTDYGFFTTCYKAIYNCNAILEGLRGNTAVSDSVGKLIRGESEFLRAFCHFRLVSFYGSVPLIETTDVTQTAAEGDSPVSEIMDSVIADLNDAYNLLPATYPSADRVRANKWAVGALLARVYLYNKDWKNAETITTRVIGSGVYSLPTDLNTVFLKSSPEVIWQLWQQNGYNFVASSWLPYSTQVYYYARPELLSAIEPGDKRKDAWLKAGIGPDSLHYYPYKYKQRLTNTGTAQEDLVELRLAEQYLIRAEAMAQENNISGGVADLNVIRERAGLSDTTAADASGLLGAIEQERRIELMMESGHRWFDLNRTGRTTLQIAPVKSTWMARDTLLPVPTAILLTNTNLKPTPGY